ncbi:hypothetical protein EGR_05382 [Echinococcus granulosus]|uniref:Uncharacterized protein n=1 Tax=Echinococcus granulosus TaxID=6210 RepID=W6UNE2_ECHGR|nr:hypothetical protein EGR_05382 [Echinococcus granulosus]EUB59762.1 hypothetical protein EGR_05382 [Echinococcus granulosus]
MHQVDNSQLARSKKHLKQDISGVKNLDFSRGVDWKEVISCTVRQPYLLSQLTLRKASNDFVGDRRDPMLLEAVYGKEMSLMNRRLHCKLDKDGICQLMTVPPNSVELAKAVFTPNKIEELFANSDFTNPILLPHDSVYISIQCKLVGPSDMFGQMKAAKSSCLLFRTQIPVQCHFCLILHKLLSNPSTSLRSDIDAEWQEENGANMTGRSSFAIANNRLEEKKKRMNSDEKQQGRLRQIGSATALFRFGSIGHPAHDLSMVVVFKSINSDVTYMVNCCAEGQRIMMFINGKRSLSIASSVLYLSPTPTNRRDMESYAFGKTK